MNTIRLSVSVCRWVARIIGTWLVAVIVLVAVREGMPNPIAQPAIVQVGFVALTLILTGILVGWRWELTGGLLSLIGVGLFYVPVRDSAKGLTWFFWALAIPGALYVSGYALAHYAARRPNACSTDGSHAHSQCGSSSNVRPPCQGRTRPEHRNE